MSHSPPGAYAPTLDVTGRFEALAAGMPAPSLVLLDRRVASLHPKLRAACRSRATQVLELTAGEKVKSLATLERIAGAVVGLPRATTVLCVGGGTLGDLATVFAHLFKRGVRLVQVPTTLLAAVDSSIGGKGAVHVRGVKNALGVFHYASERWICPELFETLSPAQRREGLIEAYKMVITLGQRLWPQYRARLPPPQPVLEHARALKDSVCAEDPYEATGERRVLNFGHTFGHVIETVTHFGTSHGDAVGLGMLAALDVGRALGVTPEVVAAEIERALADVVGAPGRDQLARALKRTTPAQIARLLGTDKKATRAGEANLVLLERIGVTSVRGVKERTWKGLLPFWRRGARP